MPEFEESDSQPNPEHNYTPSTSASKSKGGRRRSGGFKSEATSSNQKIGEVDPTEALKVGVKETSPQTESTSESDACCSTKGSKSSRSSDRAKNNAKQGNAQPSNTTLHSIQQVEEKIAIRRSEVEKKRSDRSSRGSGSRAARKNDEPKKNQSGLLETIGRLFRSLIGGSSKSAPSKGKTRSYQSKNPGKNGSRRSNGNRGDNFGRKPRNSRGGQRGRRRSISQNS